MNLLSIDNHFSEQTFESGEVLVKAGEKSEFVFLVRRGKVACFIEASSRLYPVSMIDGEGLVGEDSVFSKKPSHYSAVALEKTVVVKIPAKEIQSYVKSSPEWISTLFGEVATRLTNTIEIIGEHKIVDDRLNGGSAFTEKEEKLLKVAISN